MTSISVRQRKNKSIGIKLPVGKLVYLYNTSGGAKTGINYKYVYMCYCIVWLYIYQYKG